jgi:hypothetical protein
MKKKDQLCVFYYLGVSIISNSNFKIFHIKILSLVLPIVWMLPWVLVRSLKDNFWYKNIINFLVFLLINIYFNYK